METSDSENFESADEEVHSDAGEVAGSLNSKKRIDLAKTDVTVKVEQSEIDQPGKQEKPKVKSTKLGTKPGAKLPPSEPHPCVKNIQDIPKGFGIPPARVDCRFDDMMASQPRKIDESSSSKPKRPEYGVPPARVTCWFDGVNNAPIQPNTQELTYTFNDLMVTPIAPDEEKQVEEENMWNDDEDWEPVSDFKPTVISNDKSVKRSTENDAWEPAAEFKLTDSDNSSWGGWGNWGVSSILSTATTITSHVSQGITNVLESGIGVPDPEELARIHKEEKEKLNESLLKEPPSESQTRSSSKSFGFDLGNLVSGVTKLVETTGSKVISGGLDTLETIGKKTMEVLQEGDPGFKKKRAFLKIENDGPVLSQLLREAKEKADRENKILEDKHYSKTTNYESLFDDHQGLVHLEALEMLSKQCEIKLQATLESFSGNKLTEIQETLAQVKEICEFVDDDDEELLSTDNIKNELEKHATDINIPISFEKLILTWEETTAWLNNVNSNICNVKDIHQQAIETLAQLTAHSVEQFHKAGELLLIKEHPNTADESDGLMMITKMLISLIGVAATNFSDKLNHFMQTSKNSDEINSLITNVFFEAANSSSYIQTAFQLLIPVLQVGALKNC